jgi:hypothetical protein
MTTDRCKEAVIEELLTKLRCVDFLYIPSVIRLPSYEFFCLYARLVESGKDAI